MKLLLCEPRRLAPSSNGDRPLYFSQKERRVKHNGNAAVWDPGNSKKPAKEIFLYTWAMPPILYLDQNAWVALAGAAWDKTKHPEEHTTLVILIDAIKLHGLIVPLTFTNLYETVKINDPVRRANMAYAQSVISNGRVLLSRRRTLGDRGVEHSVLVNTAGTFERCSCNCF